MENKTNNIVFDEETRKKANNLAKKIAQIKGISTKIKRDDVVKFAINFTDENLTVDD